MAVHVVGFKDHFKYDENTKVIIGRHLLPEFFDTKEYKTIQPGDSRAFNWTQNEVVDFVKADSFLARLEISHGAHFGPKLLTLLDPLTRTYYPMFYSDLAIAAKNTIIDHGVITGRFGYVKRNIVFAIEWLGEV